MSLNELCTNSHLYRDGTGFRANARSSLDNLSVVGSHSMHSLETLINARRGASTSVLSIDKLKYDEVRKVDPIAYLTQVSEFRICLRSLSFVHFSRLVSCSSFSPLSLSLSRYLFAFFFLACIGSSKLRSNLRETTLALFWKLLNTINLTNNDAPIIHARDLDRGREEKLLIVKRNVTAFKEDENEEERKKMGAG